MVRYAVLFCALLAAVGGARAAEGLAGPYRASVLRVIDGDSFEARITIWLGQEALTIVRLAGIDTPERRAPCWAARLRAEAARAFLAGRILGQSVTLTAIAADKYGGRILAAVADETGADLAALLTAAGLARPYDGRRPDWCAD
jgi:endonuclease YncB( thermonuclease family)